MPEATESTETQSETAAPEANSEELGATGKAAIQKEREARKETARKLAETEQQRQALADKIQEFEDRDKSETQKLANQLTALQKQLADKDTEIANARTASMRSEVAADKGVPASSLSGTTKEELEASADELIAWREAHSPKRKAPTGSSGLKSGASGSGDQSADPKERAAAALRDMRKGT